MNLTLEELVTCFESIKDKYIGDQYRIDLYEKRKDYFGGKISVHSYSVLSGLTYIQACAAIEGFPIPNELAIEAYKQIVPEGTIDDFLIYREGSTKCYQDDIDRCLGPLGR